MTRPVEPTWPTPADVEREVERLVDAGGTEWSYAGISVRLCRAAWLAATDDPSEDLPGTVRISPDGDTVVSAVTSASDTTPWMNVSAISTGRRGGWWLSHDAVVGWAHGNPIPGTPAWDAAQAVSS